MKKLALIVLALTLAGCDKGPEHRVVELPKQMVIPSGSIVSVQVEDDQTFKVHSFGYVDPTNCYLLPSGEPEYRLKRKYIRFDNLRCGDKTIPFEGYAVGDDAMAGLRYKVDTGDIADQDRYFSVVLTKIVPVGGLKLEYYSDTVLKFPEPN